MNAGEWCFQPWWWTVLTTCEITFNISFAGVQANNSDCMDLTLGQSYIPMTLQTATWTGFSRQPACVKYLEVPVVNMTINKLYKLTQFLIPKVRVKRNGWYHILSPLKLLEEKGHLLRLLLETSRSMYSSLRCPKHVPTSSKRRVSAESASCSPAQMLLWKVASAVQQCVQLCEVLWLLSFVN